MTSPHGLTSILEVCQPAETERLPRDVVVTIGDRACRRAGRWLLEYARGRDVTALFHSIHLRNEGTASAALTKLPRLDAASVGLPSAPGLPPSALAAEGATQGAYVLDLYGDAPADAPLPPIDSPLRRDLRRLLRKVADYLLSFA